MAYPISNEKVQFRKTIDLMKSKVAAMTINSYFVQQLEEYGTIQTLKQIYIELDKQKIIEIMKQLL